MTSLMWAETLYYGPNAGTKIAALRWNMEDTPWRKFSDDYDPEADAARIAEKERQAAEDARIATLPVVPTECLSAYTFDEDVSGTNCRKAWYEWNSMCTKLWWEGETIPDPNSM